LDATLHLVAGEPAEIAALGLGAIHGPIRLAQQFGHVAAVARIESNAKTGGDQNLLAVDRSRRRDRVEHLARHQSRMLRLRQVFDQDGEFVAAEARDRVGLAQPPPQALGHDDQEAIARRVPEAIIDRLEAVQVEDHHRDQRTMAPRPG
jgi:hypothetical protein